MKQIDLSLQVRDTHGLVLGDNKLSLEVGDLLPNLTNIVLLLLVVNLSFVESTFLDLDFFVKKSQLLVSFDQLSSQNISLVDDHLIIFLLLLLFRFRFANDIFESSDITLLGFDHIFRALNVFLDLLDVRQKMGVFGVVVFLFLLLRNDLLILLVDFFLKLGNLLSHSSELHFELGNLFLGLQKVLGVQISVGSYSFIEILLLLESTFSLNILFLQSDDQIVLDLNLFQTLIVFGISLRSFNTILLFIFLKLMNEFLKFLCFSFVTLDLVLKLLKLILQSGNGANLFTLFLLSSGDILVEQVSLTSLLLDEEPICKRICAQIFLQPKPPSFKAPSSVLETPYQITAVVRCKAWDLAIHKQ